MEIRIEKVTSWEDVVNAARFTQHKKPLGHEPSDTFKAMSCLDEHSPLRELVFKVFVYDAPFHVMTHLVRHNEGLNKYVATSRPDRNIAPVPRHEQRKDDPCDFQFTMNAQAFITVSRWRLCRCAEKETRDVWNAVIAELAKVDKILASKCQPTCIYRGFCPERDCCGFVNTAIYKAELAAYRGEQPAKN